MVSPFPKGGYIRPGGFQPHAFVVIARTANSYYKYNQTKSKEKTRRKIGMLGQIAVSALPIEG